MQGRRSGGDPVFYDPEHRRWPRLRLLLLLACLAIGLVLAALVTVLLARSQLPELALVPAEAPGTGHRRPEALPPPPPQQAAMGMLAPALKAIEDRERRRQLALTRRRPQHATTSNATVASELRTAFLVDWDPGSAASLTENGENLDLVFPEWLHCHGTGAVLSEDEPARREQVLAALRPFAPRLHWMPLVNNCDAGHWDGSGLAEALALPASRARLAKELVDFAVRVGGSGICVDFEDLDGDLPEIRPGLPPTLRPNRRPRPVKPHVRYEPYLLFLHELSLTLKAQHLDLAVCVPWGNPTFPYVTTAASADLLVGMAYDQHWEDGPPGPLADQTWFEQGLARLADVPRRKLVVGIGSYAYDWGGDGAANPLGSDGAVTLARKLGATWTLDPGSLNPAFAYSDAAGKAHQVWALDAITAFNQMATARKAAAGGFAIWRLGAEDPSLWRLLPHGTDLNEATMRNLAEVPAASELEFAGEGEAMRVTAAPAVGRRELTFDAKRGLITGATWREYASPWVVTRYGKADKRIVLTFDDGPDPDWTPAILDALRAANAPAVFFVVGAQAERHPELIDRISAEGHELGNHTFTHPNILNLSLSQLELELNFTQRLLESRTGRHTLLFRPPYGLDTEPRTIPEVHSVEAVNALGYLCVGMHLDPQDWNRPGVDAIVERVVEAAEHGDGNVVLLHDSGGDRTQTVAALPRLIDELRQHGFELCSLSTLLGTSRDDLMPPVQHGWAQTLMTWAGFGMVSLGLKLLGWLFVGGVVLGLARLGFICVLAVIEHRRSHRLQFDKRYRPLVAVVVPGYNEEKVVVQTVRSLLDADYRGPLEIIVVDDGSKDATYRVACEAFANEPRVRVFTKPNGGKSAALNFGIARTQAEVVVGLDADTVFARDTVRKLVRHFADPKVGAVAGNAKVGNRLNLLTRWQALEYITCQNLDRRAFSLLNCITVVPGAVGAWRRCAVIAAGGFTHATLAEDADLTMCIRRAGYRVRNEDEAVAHTEAPDTVRGFVKQRFRWMFGTIQAAFHHRGALFNPRYGMLGFIALPNIIIFQVFFPLVSPVMDLALLVALGGWAWDSWQHPGHGAVAWGVLGYYLLFVIVDHLAAWLAFALEPAEDRGLMWWLFLQRFSYRQLMYYVAIRSTIAALRGHAVGWGTLERKGTVQAGVGR